MHHDYKEMKSVVDKMYVLIDKTLQQAYKPAVLVLKRNIIYSMRTIEIKQPSSIIQLPY